MVVKVYISGISGNKEVKKRQQRVLLILDSKNVKYEILDIAEPNMEEAKEYMQNNSKLLGGTIGDPNPRHPLPPQIFNEEEYCGDYDAFDMANELDEMEKFLKLAPGDTIITSNVETTLGNGEVVNDETKDAKEISPEKDVPTNDTDDAKLKINEDNTVPIMEETQELEEDAQDNKENESDDQKIKNGSREVDVEATEIETEKSEEA
ncbi:SH3 domain-binding glutamic acid-rich protein homolog [Cylas formicarius]|uniref:SH3 domain-binding glutamic acid-rich protein homolog n=1 Tax=Cylas formicarius TaxID=197179 RepID=UPI0029589C9C|nr:SH3 domain-binding glutamic acid-rich protein homolog [Cylas formicarius]